MLKILRIFISTIIHTYKAIKSIKLYGDSTYYSTARQWSEQILQIADIKVEVFGRENISSNETYIFAANHSDLFDIPVLLVALQHDFRIIYKKELEKIPIFGPGIAKSPYIGIVRDNPSDALKSIDSAIQSVKEGISVLVFPEGTRTKTGELGQFKRGGFMLAARSGKPVVPVFVKGTFGLSSSSKFRIKSGKVIVNIGEPIIKKSTNSSEEKALMQLVYQKLKKLSENY